MRTFFDPSQLLLHWTCANLREPLQRMYPLLVQTSPSFTAVGSEIMLIDNANDFVCIYIFYRTFESRQHLEN